MLTISAAAEGRDNNFTVLRFLAATAVIWFHSFALTLRAQEEPLHLVLSRVADLGVLGVLAFFVISGFLVTRSFDKRDSALRFAWARALRIYPGLIVATVFTIVVGALCSTVSFPEFMTSSETSSYLWHTAGGWDVRHDLPGTFKSNPYPHSVNGSLWTLPMELRMYAGCFLAGLLTLLRRRWLFNLAFATSVAFFAWQPDTFPVNPGLWVARQLGLGFSIGAFAWVNRTWIALSLPAIALAIAGAVTLPGWPWLVFTFVPLFAYGVLGIALHPRLVWHRASRAPDYSYGLYIYAFPIQQLILTRWPALHPVALFAVAFAPVLIVAALSWHFIERPALRLKSRVPFAFASPHARRTT
jgi:peptidoglycan/LPS O-acetylase OafA/YrhL